MRGTDEPTPFGLRIGARSEGGLVASASGRDDARRLRADVPGDGGRALWPGLARIDGLVQAGGGEEPGAGALSRGRQRASGAGDPDGGAVGSDGGSLPDRRSEPQDFSPEFERSVPKNGYAWWYVDALSDDGAHGLTVIAFIGSVFSPYYALARRLGPVDPANHCCMNVALYGRPKRWAMTERRAGALVRDADHIAIGASSLVWDGTALTLSLQERTMPGMSRLAGTVRIIPETLFDTAYKLDEGGLHRWRPMAPFARAEVRFEAPSLSWSGSAYFDSNYGARPLEADFRDWDWSRTTRADGASVLYDVRYKTGAERRLSLLFKRDGSVEPYDAPEPVVLPRGFWRMPRATRARQGERVGVVSTLEDSPFYARSALVTEGSEGTRHGVHESLSLDRFTLPIVQAMLPFRIPRTLR